LFNKKFKRQKRQFEEKFIIEKMKKQKDKRKKRKPLQIPIEKNIFGYFLIANQYFINKKKTFIKIYLHHLFIFFPP
jgi:hypothetical protein